jgi:hypothetical protein
MLYFIAVWMLLFVVCGVMGTAVLNQLQADCFERRGDRLMAAAWLGLVILSIALLAASLVLSLSPLVGLLVALCLVTLSLCSAAARAELRAIWRSRLPAWTAAAVVLAVTIAAFTTQQVTWVDTGLYHYSVIQWFARFGTVPGVALLFSNFGFTSSWFALAAPLNAELLGARVSAVTNGFALLLAALHVCICLSHGFTNKARFSDWFLVAFFSIILPLVVGIEWLSINVLSEILISPSPDVPVIFLIGVVAWSTLVCSSPPASGHQASGWNPGAPLIPLLLAVGAVSVKLIAIPLVLISSLFFLFNQKFAVGRILTGGTIAALLLTPLLISSIITSGCPLYPSGILCLDLPWSPAAQSIERVARSTHSPTDWYGTPPAGVPSLLWVLWRWFNDKLVNQITAGLIVASTLAVTYLARSFKLNRPYEYLWVAAIGALGIGFIMFTSPLFRFSLGYVALLPALLIAIVGSRQFAGLPAALAQRSSWRFSKYWRRAIQTAPGWVSAVVLTIVLSRGAQSLFLPPPLPQVEVTEKQVNDLTYLSPQGKDLCWATRVPCAFTVAPDVKLRNPDRGIDAGFVRSESHRQT